MKHLILAIATLSLTGCSAFEIALMGATIAIERGSQAIYDGAQAGTFDPVAPPVPYDSVDCSRNYGDGKTPATCPRSER